MSIFFGKNVLVILSFLMIFQGCGGGGNPEEPQQPNEEMADRQGNGDGGQGNGDGPGNGNGGEGPGQCKALDYEKLRFRFELVQEITQPSTPANQKQLIIRTYATSGDNVDLLFTTNNGQNDSGFCMAECGNPDFVAEYEQTFGVINLDCRT